MLPASNNSTNPRPTAASRNATAAPIQNTGSTSLSKKRPAPPAHQEVRANASIKHPRHCCESNDYAYDADTVIEHHGPQCARLAHQREHISAAAHGAGPESRPNESHRQHAIRRATGVFQSARAVAGHQPGGPDIGDRRVDSTGHANDSNNTNLAGHNTGGSL